MRWPWVTVGLVPHHLGKIDEMLSAGSTLQVIARDASGLFSFTPSPLNEASRYGSPDSDDGLAGDVNKLMALLTTMREKRTVSRGIVDEITDLERRLQEDLTLDNSPVICALRSYVVDLGPLLVETMVDADGRLAKEEGLTSLLGTQIEKLTKLRSEGTGFLVLCDRYLLFETLRNLFFNLRHSFPKEARGRIPTNAVEIEVIEEERDLPNEPGKVGAVRLRLKVKTQVGLRVDQMTQASTTFGSQLNRLSEFGVNRRFARDEDDSQIVELSFIGRREFERRGDSR